VVQGSVLEELLGREGTEGEDDDEDQELLHGCLHGGWVDEM
jgi:hypothetical protein